ncbi:MAG: DcaP family trimeric outer membrane transporter [Bacteroidales bacterium]|nr:DcaP family trimeric outer membrane transporter [Bacteroidales bacterium]
MKKIFILISLLTMMNLLFSQNDEKQVKFTYSVDGFINLNAICDFNGLNDYDDFTTSEIPIHPTSYEKHTRYHMTARQSQLNFNMNYKTPIGSISGKISGDFYSGNTGEYSVFRLREAYIQYKNLLLGQTNTTFGNPDVVPVTIDFEGPNSAPSLRNPMIKYTNKINHSWKYGVALEMRGTDITSYDSSDSPFSTVPSFIANIYKTGKWGSVTFSGMTSVTRYFNSMDQPKAVLGYGAAFSALFNTTKKDHFSVFTVAGKGIANFISDLSGNGYNGVLVINPDQMNLLNSYGGFVGYTHYWNEKWNSNLIYSFVGLEKTNLISKDDFQYSNYALINLFFQPIEAMVFGIEFIRGDLFTQDNSTGNANRLQFLAQFNF